MKVSYKNGVPAVSLRQRRDGVHRRVPESGCVRRNP